MDDIRQPVEYLDAGYLQHRRRPGISAFSVRRGTRRLQCQAGCPGQGPGQGPAQSQEPGVEQANFQAGQALSVPAGPSSLPVAS